MKFALPNAKPITLVQLPEDIALQKELRVVVGGDIMFRSPIFVEKLPETESIACVLFENAVDHVALAQAFCQPLYTLTEKQVKENKKVDSADTNASAELNNALLLANASEKESVEAIRVAERFLRHLGQTIRRDKGFYVSPLFTSNAGTMGKLSSSHLTAEVHFTSGQQSSQATLLDATYSNATPNKLVRVSAITGSGSAGLSLSSKKRNSKRTRFAQRNDERNVLRLGARTFLRELCLSRNVPWAVLRAGSTRVLTAKDVAAASMMFDLSLMSGKKANTSNLMIEGQINHTKDDNAQNSVASSEEEKEQLHLCAMVECVANVLKDIASFLPNNVVEFHPDAFCPPQYSIADAEKEMVIHEEVDEEKKIDEEDDEEVDEEQENEEEEEEAEEDEEEEDEEETNEL